MMPLKADLAKAGSPERLPAFSAVLLFAVLLFMDMWPARI